MKSYSIKSESAEFVAEAAERRVQRMQGADVQGVRACSGSDCFSGGGLADWQTGRLT